MSLSVIENSINHFHLIDEVHKVFHFQIFFFLHYASVCFAIHKDGAFLVNDLLSSEETSLLYWDTNSYLMFHDVRPLLIIVITIDEFPVIAIRDIVAKHREILEVHLIDHFR